MDDRLAQAVRTLIRTTVREELQKAGTSSVEQKGPGDLVTDLDRHIGTELGRALHQLTPEIPVFSEDSDGPGESQEPWNASVAGNEKDVWIVDPIDGTANYVMGNSHYATSVALVRDGSPVAGFVYHPPTDTMYWSVCSGSAFANENPISPSSRDDLGRSYIVFGFSAALPNILRCHREWTPAFDRSRKAIGLLAPALNLCHVAAGSVDAFIDFGCSMEGQAAAGVILRNAGGTVADYDGRPWSHSTVGVYGSNGAIRPNKLIAPQGVWA